jgi:hypothetical protein
MKNIKNQQIIFTLKLLLYILLTFIIYILIKQYFIIENCSWIKWWIWSWYICWGYLNFFNKSSIYIYILFLWLTIVPYVNIKYKWMNNKIFIIGMFIILLIILSIYTTTPIEFKNWLPLKMYN